MLAAEALSDPKGIRSMERLVRGGWRALRALPLVVVVVAPALASWRGLVETGHVWLGLPGDWAVLVPLTLDSAATYAAVLAMRSVLAGDSALVDRLLVWAYALGAAGLNLAFHRLFGGAPSALYYAAASVSAVVLWGRTLRAWRRDQLRLVGAIEPPLPRFRALRWVIAPTETARAWRVAVMQGLSTPAEALALVTGPTAGQLTSSPRAAVEQFSPTPGPLFVAPSTAEPAPLEESELEDRYAPLTVDELMQAHSKSFMSQRVREELAECDTKAQMLAVAWRELGVVGVPATSDVMPAVGFLADYGISVDRSRAYELRRAVERKAAGRDARVEHLAVVGGAR